MVRTSAVIRTSCVALAAFGLALPDMVHAADQFDLHCEGRASGSFSAKQERHYRVDLAKNEWCDDECDNVFQIAEITSGRIVFSKKERTFPGDFESLTMVNRVDGSWYIETSRSLRDIPIKIEGTCEPASFSGFSSQSTKF